MKFVRQLNNCQKITWSMLITAFAGHMLITTPILEFPVNLFSLILYLIGCVLGFGILYKLSVLDPIDKSKPIDYRNCEYCNKKVHRKSNHCKICRGCVRGFDHHSIWLNKCIGKLNYKLFMCMLLLFSLNYGLGFSLSVAAITNLAKGNPYGINFNFYLGLSIMAILCDGIVFLIASNLLCFHIYLKCKNLSAYEFMILKQMKTGKVAVENDINYPHIRNAKLFTVKEESDTVYHSRTGLKSDDRHVAEEEILGRVLEEINEHVSE